MSNELYTGFEGVHSKDITKKGVNESLIINESAVQPLIDRVPSLENLGVISNRYAKYPANIHNTYIPTDSGSPYDLRSHPVIKTHPDATSKEQEVYRTPLVTADNERDPAVGQAIIDNEATINLNSGNIVETGGVVDSWGGFLTNKVGSPAYITDWYNGLPAVSGDQGNYLYSDLSDLLRGTEYTMFFVTAPNVAPDTDGIIYSTIAKAVPTATLCSSYSAYSRHRFYSGTNNDLTMGITSVSTTSEIAVASPQRYDTRYVNKPFIVSYRSPKYSDSTLPDIWINSVKGKPPVSLNGNTEEVNKSLILFRDVCTNTTLAHGTTFGEFVIIPRRLSDEEILQVETAIQNRWKIGGETGFLYRNAAKYGISTPISGATPRDGSKGTALIAEATVHLKGEDLVDNLGVVDNWGSLVDSKVGSPTYIANFANGIPGVQVDKSNYLFSSAALVELDADEYTYFCVAKHEVVSNDSFCCVVNMHQGDSGNYATNQRAVFTHRDTGGKLSIDTFERGVGTSNSHWIRSPIKNIEPFLASYRSGINGRLEEDVDIKARINGLAHGYFSSAHAGAAGTGSRVLNIGDYNASSVTNDTGSAQIAEFIFIPRRLTDEEIREVETTLDIKYALKANSTNKCLDFASRNLEDEAFVTLDDANLDYTGTTFNDWGDMLFTGGSPSIEDGPKGYKVVNNAGHNLQTDRLPGLSPSGEGWTFVGLINPQVSNMDYGPLTLQRNIGDWINAYGLRFSRSGFTNVGAIQWDNSAVGGTVWRNVTSSLFKPYVVGKYSTLGGSFPDSVNDRLRHYQDGVYGADQVYGNGTPQFITRTPRKLVLSHYNNSLAKFLEVRVFPKELTQAEMQQVIDKMVEKYYTVGDFQEQNGYLTGRGAVLATQDTMWGSNDGGFISNVSPGAAVAMEYNSEVQFSFQTKNSYVDGVMTPSLTPNLSPWKSSEKWFETFSLSRHTFQHTLKLDVTNGQALISAEATVVLNETNIQESGGNVTGWGSFLDGVSGVPTLETAFLNGLDGVRVSYTDALYTTTRKAELNSDEFTIFIVGKRVSGSGVIFDASYNPAPTVGTSRFDSITTLINAGLLKNFVVNSAGSFSNSFDKSGFVDGDTYVLTLATGSDIDKGTVRVNGSYLPSQFRDNYPTDRGYTITAVDRYMSLGNGVNTYGTTNIDIIGEVIVIPRKLTNIEMLEVEAHLNNKWGFATATANIVDEVIYEEDTFYMDHFDGNLKLGRRFFATDNLYSDAHSGEIEVLSQTSWVGEHPYYAVTEEARRMYPVQGGIDSTFNNPDYDVKLSYRFGDAAIELTRNVEGYTFVSSIHTSWPSTPQGNHTNVFYTGAEAMIDDLSVNTNDGNATENNGIPTLNRYMNLTSQAAPRTPTTTGFRGFKKDTGVVNATLNAGVYVTDGDLNTKAEALSVGDELGLITVDRATMEEMFNFKGFDNRKPVYVGVEYKNLARWTTDLGFSLETVIAWNGAASDDIGDMTAFNLGGIQVKDTEVSFTKKNLDTVPTVLSINDLNNLNAYLKVI
jgi:hypothetical protein